MSIDIQEQSIFVNNTNIYCEKAGEGEVLLLIHGAGGDRRYWDEQFLELALHFQVVRYDLRGFGKSDLPVEKEPYKHEDDLYALLKALNVEKAHIAGFSLGCKIAIDAYTLYPQIFKSIIAVGPYVTGYESDAANRFFGALPGCADAYKESGQKGAAEYFANIPDFKPEHIDTSIKEKVLSICSEHSWWWTTHEDPAETVSPLAVTVLDNINVPVLIVTAEFDIDVCREVADFLQKHLLNSKRIDFPDASHFMLLERPNEFNQAVVSFIDELSG